jgi:hypothetical protein
VENMKEAWKNAYYRATMTYITVLVTLIFGFQMYRYFVSAPFSEVRCPQKTSTVSLSEILGVLLYG